MKKDDITPATKEDIKAVTKDILITQTNVQKLETRVGTLEEHNKMIIHRIECMQKQIDSNTAAIHKLRQDLVTMKQELTITMEKIEERMARGFDEVLRVLVNIDKRLTGDVEQNTKQTRKLEKRVDHIELERLPSIEKEVGIAA